MKLVKLYEDVIREGEAQACVAKFGRELFDPQLKVSSEPSNVEPNTDVEQHHLDAIFKFTGLEYGANLNQDFLNVIDNLKSCATTYPEILEPYGTAYRGTVITLRELLNQYDDIADDLSKGGEFTINYKPKSPIQSWTSDEGVAEGFSKVSPALRMQIGAYKEYKDDPDKLANFARAIHDELSDITCPIIISLNTSKDDFLFKAKYFAELSEFGHEKELLRVTNRATMVTGKIITVYLESVFGILTAVRKYEQSLR